MTLHDHLIPALRDMLATVTGMIAKAEANGGDPLLHAAIAPDMHPLAWQLRFIANIPGEALGKLTGEAGPHWEDDNPETLADAKARIAEAKAALDALDPAKICAADTRISLHLPNGMAFELSAEEYVRDWVLPNFYFHVTTAYAILRNRGVPLGKSDFIPHMGRYFKAPPV